MRTVYECDHCGKRFDDWEECFNHKQSHVRPTDIVKFGLYEEGSEYPKVIVIRMSDDKEVTYSLDL